MKYLMLFAVFLMISCEDLTKNYGNKVFTGKSEVYYDDGASRKNADVLLNHLLEINWLKDRVHGTAQIVRTDTTLAVKLAIRNEELSKSLKDPERLAEFERIKGDLIELYGEEIDLHLCNRRLETKKVL